MKYLRKFATQSDYDAYVESGEMETPNVSLVAESYTTFFTKKEIEIPLGVFIQHINGKLYTADEWTAKGFANSEANGVAVSVEECAFVIAKENLGNNNTQWSSDAINAVKGLDNISNRNVAKKDYNGKANTQLMLATDTSGAGYSCANYIFPNGQNGYLPSLGELNVAFNNKAVIDEAMSVLDSSPFYSHAWSSTPYADYLAWYLDWSDGITNYHNKASSNTVVPFTTL